MYGKVIPAETSPPEFADLTSLSTNDGAHWEMNAVLVFPSATPSRWCVCMGGQACSVLLTYSAPPYNTAIFYFHLH